MVLKDVFAESCNISENTIILTLRLDEYAELLNGVNLLIKYVRSWDHITHKYQIANERNNENSSTKIDPAFDVVIIQP